MRWGGRYSAINRDLDGAHSEPLEMDNMVTDEAEEARSVPYYPIILQNV